MPLSLELTCHPSMGNWSPAFFKGAESLFLQSPASCGNSISFPRLPQCVMKKELSWAETPNAGSDDIQSKSRLFITLLHVWIPLPGQR